MITITLKIIKFIVIPIVDRNLKLSWVNTYYGKRLNERLKRTRHGPSAQHLKNTASVHETHQWLPFWCFFLELSGECALSFQLLAWKGLNSPTFVASGNLSLAIARGVIIQKWTVLFGS